MLWQLLHVSHARAILQIKYFDRQKGLLGGLTCYRKRYATLFEFGQWQVQNIWRTGTRALPESQIPVNDLSISRVALDRSVRRFTFTKIVFVSFSGPFSHRTSNVMRARNLAPKFFCRRAFIFAPFLARSLSPVISLI